MAKKPQEEKTAADSDKRTEAEAEKIRDAALKRMLGTPPKPHADEKPKKSG